MGAPHTAFLSTPSSPSLETPADAAMTGSKASRRTERARPRAPRHTSSRRTSRTPSSIAFLLSRAPQPSLWCVLQTLVLTVSFLPGARSFAASSFATPRLSSYETWEHEAWLEDTGAFVVQWTPREDSIEFRVTARTTGYIGFGLSSAPRMDGADIVVG